MIWAASSPPGRQTTHADPCTLCPSGVRRRAAARPEQRGRAAPAGAGAGGARQTQGQAAARSGVLGDQRDAMGCHAAACRGVAWAAGGGLGERKGGRERTGEGRGCGGWGWRVACGGYDGRGWTGAAGDGREEEALGGGQACGRANPSLPRCHRRPLQARPPGCRATSPNAYHARSRTHTHGRATTAAVRPSFCGPRDDI